MLYAQKVEIGANNAEGYIKSAGYREGEKGFIIRWNGDCEFNNGLFRGIIEALGGVFHGRIEADEGYFHGRVEAEEGYFKNGTFENVNVSGNSTFEGSIKPTNGIFCSRRLSNNNSQNQSYWFNLFENIIPVGSSLCVFGGMLLQAEGSSTSVNAIISSIERTNANTIRIHYLGSTTSSNGAVSTFASGSRDCTRGNNTRFSVAHSISW